ncbi:hypothetical protein SAMN05216223_104156 [Actinacidiphila yanglinensis]|uniref:Uncharacterized protein n=1 Tax=Actinacidiphila yanglinensis TaxID=310779 RepID=A0A1H5YWC5_9ACTN|nr:hypothetical protein [Actinacidiphila yanglinensis]SEG27725.1 hypothetical protein SAMN05216223_104156 [Actinacidiphila yanglinensis]
MPDAVLVLLLLLAAGASAVLALRALRHWYGERAGRVYELPVDHRGTLLRAGASSVAALVAATVAVPLLHDAASGPVRTRAVAARKPGGRPSPPARTPEPAPPPPELRTLGRPGGGTLQELRDGTRVWLPRHYTTPAAADIAYPVVVVHDSSPSASTSVSPSAASAASFVDTALYSAFAGQAAHHLANSFLLVTPPACGTDSAAVLTEVAAHYRTLTGRAARGVIGIGTQAPCAVREALSHPGRYAAAAGISGSYPSLTRPTGRYPSLLLASTASEAGQRASGVRLRTSLRPTGDQVRLLDGVPRAQDLLAQVAAYLTEKLDGPARTPTAHLTPAPTAPGTSAAPTAVPTGTGPADGTPHGTATTGTSPSAPHSVTAPTSRSARERTRTPVASPHSSAHTTHPPAPVHKPATAPTSAPRRTPRAAPRTPSPHPSPHPHTSTMPGRPRATPGIHP